MKNVLNLLISNEKKLHFFNRLFKNIITYETTVYSSGKKTDSSCVKYISNNNEKIGFIKYFVKTCLCGCNSLNTCYNCCNSCKVYGLIVQCETELAFFDNDNTSISTMYTCKESKELIAIEIENIICVF